MTSRPYTPETRAVPEDGEAWSCEERSMTQDKCKYFINGKCQLGKEASSWCDHFAFWMWCPEGLEDRT